MSTFNTTPNPICPICKAEIHLNWPPISSAIPPHGFEVLIPAGNGKMKSYHGGCVMEELRLLEKLKNQMTENDCGDDQTTGTHLREAWRLIKKMQGK